MNQVATDYAHRNRYQFNGKKSNVMAFNANEAGAEQVQSEPWVLFGEVVKVSTSYKYLGVELLSNLNNWAPYLHRAIAKARRTLLGFAAEKLAFCPGLQQLCGKPSLDPCSSMQLNSGQETSARSSLKALKQYRPTFAGISSG